MTEMVAPAESGERKLYARKTSGLIRTIGVFGAMVFGGHCISLSSSGLIPYSLIAWIPLVALPTLTRSMGIIFSNPSLVSFADWSASSTGIFVIGTICAVITFLTMILPTRTIVRILEVGFFLGLLAWVILYFQLGTAAPDAFPAAWDRFMGAGSFEGRIALAQQNGMVINPNVAIMTLAGLIMGFWVFYGYYIPTFFAGEVKQAENTLLAGSWSSLVVTWAIFVLGALLLQRLVPLEWIAAESYLGQTPAAGVTAMPWITFYAAILSPSFPLVLIVAIAWIYTLINLAQTYFFYCSRIIFAWSFDRLIPEAVCWIHPTLRSPIWAILIIAVVAEVGIIDSSGLLWAGSVMGAQLNFVFFAVVTMFVPVIAMTLFPYLKPDLYQNASAMVRRKLGSVPLITVVGGITLTYMVWMVIASFLYPAVGGGINATKLAVLAGLVVTGLAVFYGARAYRLSREGIDINWTFQSVPPV